MRRRTGPADGLGFAASLAFVVALLAGCGSDPGQAASGEPAGEPREGAVPADGESARWTVEPEPFLTIGVGEGRAPYQFHDITAVAVQADGDVVVADAGDRTVRIYDASGTFLRAVGSGGRGPGEFLRPSRVVLGPADSILVWDDEAWRLTRFDEAGDLDAVASLLESLLEATADPPLYPLSAQPLVDGGLVVRLEEKGKEAPASSRVRPQAALLRLSHAFAVVASLEGFAGPEQVWVDAPWGKTPMEPPLARDLLVAVQPNGLRVCAGDQSGSRVRCLQPDGSVVSVAWEETGGAIPPTELEVTAWRSEMLDVLAQKLAPDQARDLVDRVPLSMARPPYGRLALDRVGDLWVELGPPPGTPAARECLVFDSLGARLATVTMPRMRPMEIGHDYVAGVAEDELGVQSVVIHRLHRAPR